MKPGDRRTGGRTGVTFWQRQLPQDAWRGAATRGFSRSGNGQEAVLMAQVSQLSEFLDTVNPLEAPRRGEEGEYPK